MPYTLKQLLENNAKWVAATAREQPGLFEQLERGQSPDYLWISCADSRVAPIQALGVEPGEVFVHRNIANVIVPSDLNAMSVIQFAVDTLKTRHALMVGHYSCGGCAAALDDKPRGLIDSWLAHVKAVVHRHSELLDQAPDDTERRARLCELNAIEQAINLCYTSVVRQAWQRGQPLTVHTWMYGLADGYIRDLGMDIDSPEALAPAYEQALTDLQQRWQARLS